MVPQSCRSRLAGAQYALGKMYESGRGVPQDNIQAVAWYRKAAEQGSEEAKTKLVELEALQNPKRDPNDVVGQVLNYTVFGVDEGLSDNFWHKAPSGKCLYRLHISGNKPLNGSADNIFKQITDFSKMFSVQSALMQRQVIDLDQFDPKNITFRYDNNPTAWGQNGVGTIVQHINEILFFYIGALDINRLQRGWRLIYSNYCHGKEKPF